MNDRAPASYLPLTRSVAKDIALNATIPVACYYGSKAYLSPSDLTALLIATAFPLLKSIHDLLLHRELNPVSLLILLGIMTSIVALFFGGDRRILLVRESLFTGAFGAACLVSLVAPRPMMFYFGRYFMAGKDPEKRKVFNLRWANPIVRRGHRLVTTVWGIVYLGEFGTRVILIYTLPASAVLAIAPVLMGVATIVMIIWTFRYAYLLRDRVVQ
jgi:hypothetical protein